MDKTRIGLRYADKKERSRKEMKKVEGSRERDVIGHRKELT
jgi:hypothetical protein